MRLVSVLAISLFAIVTRHLGARKRLEIDPSQEFFFHVRREDAQIQGPLTRDEWERSDLPTLSSLPWVEPRSSLFRHFAGFGALHLVSPPLLVGLAVLAAIWLLRRRTR